MEMFLGVLVISLLICAVYIPTFIRRTGFMFAMNSLVIIAGFTNGFLATIIWITLFVYSMIRIIK